MAEAHAVILAAGFSRRMGARNKLLLDMGGVPMIKRVVQTYCRALKGDLYVVTGFERDQLASALAELPVKIVHNPRFADGQQTSVVAGLSQITGDAPTLLGLGDQPALSSDDIDWLIAQHALMPDKITIPRDATGARGNPIVIPSALRAQMLANPKSPGCRKFTRENPDLVNMVQTSAPGFFADVDTPEDYTQFGQKMQDYAGDAK
jgi:molybdenum cofactor cytidylyltransferase